MQIVEQSDAVRKRTQKPLGINLFVEHPPYTADPAHIARAHARLAPFRTELGLSQPPAPAVPVDHYQRQIDAVLAARPDLFTFTFGIPDAAMLQRFRASGIFTMGTATTVAEARALKAADVDGTFVQGSEAGAHRGPFLALVDASMVGTLALVPQVVDATELPVFAAGGIATAGASPRCSRSERSPRRWARFCSRLNPRSRPRRDVLRSERAHDSIVTRAFSGKAARGVANRITAALRDPDDIAPYPFQNAMTRDIRTAAAAQGNAEYRSLWAGQAALAREAPAREIFARLVCEARAALRGSHLKG